MLEFVFERVTLETGLFQPLSFKIGDDAWASAKQAEQAASGGRGNIGAAKEGRRGANPFFKFFLADAECCVARGRGGGLAMWKRLSDEPQLPTPEPLDPPPPHDVTWTYFKQFRMSNVGNSQVPGECLKRNKQRRRREKKWMKKW